MMAKKAKKKQSKKPPKLKPVIIRDTREKCGYKFNSSANCGGTIVQKLNAGDYSIVGLEDYIIIERKESMDELCKNLGKERARFMRELERMAHVKHKFLIIEDYASSIFKRRFSHVKGSALLGSLASLMLKHGVQVIFAGQGKIGKAIAARLLHKAHEYYLREQDEKIDEFEEANGVQNN
jgi:ERCC4-type nuclease